jgi:hypothetical protein
LLPGIGGSRRARFQRILLVFGGYAQILSRRNEIDRYSVTLEAHIVRNKNTLAGKFELLEGWGWNFRGCYLLSRERVEQGMIRSFIVMLLARCMGLTTRHRDHSGLPTPSFRHATAVYSLCILLVEAAFHGNPHSLYLSEAQKNEADMPHPTI